MPSLIAIDHGPCALQASGAWTVAHVELLERLCDRVPRERSGPIDLSGVTALDTVGAWLFEKLARRGAAGSSQPILVRRSATGLSRRRRPGSPLFSPRTSESKPE